MIKSAYQKKTNAIHFAKAFKSDLKQKIAIKFKSELLRAEQAVLEAIIDYWNFKQNLAWPSLTTIAEKSRYCKGYIIEQVKNLEAKGFIEVIRSKINSRESNRYRLTDKVLQLIKKPEELEGKEIKTCQSVNSAESNNVSKIKTNINNKNNEKACVNFLNNSRREKTSDTEAAIFIEEIIFESNKISGAEKVNTERNEVNISENNKNKDFSVISSLANKLNSQNIFIKLKYLLKFAAKHGLQQLQNSIQAAQAYIQNQTKANKSFNASKITQAALNLEQPWKFDQEKHLDLDVAKEAEKQRLKLKPLFETTTYLKCPQTGQKLALDLNNFDRSCFKKLNPDSGEYEFFVFAQNTQTGEQVKLKVNPDNPPLLQETDNKPDLQTAKQKFKYLFDERAILICPKTGIKAQLEPQHFNSPAKLQGYWNEGLSAYEFIFQSMINGKLIRIELCEERFENRLAA